MTAEVKGKVAWVSIVVAVIAGLSANLQTILSTAGERADKANSNVKAIVESMRAQIETTDAIVLELAEKVESLHDDIEKSTSRQEDDIDELRQMLFTLAFQKNKTNKKVEESLEQLLESSAKKPAKRRSAAKVAKPVAPNIRAAQMQRPKWPPELME